MEVLSESKKILLAKLKFRDPERYKKKLNLFGVSENELVDYVQRENTRIKSITKKDNTKSGHEYYMGGSPYWSYEPATPRAVSNNSLKKAAKVGKKIIIMIDGDNHPYEAIEGIEEVSGKADVTIFATDNNLLKKIELKLGKKGIKQVRTVLVKKGAQAVDNRIKTELGKEAKSHDHSKIAIVSHDQGYRKKIKEWKQKWRWSDDKIILCKCIKKCTL